MGNDRARLEEMQNACGLLLGYRVFYANERGVWVSDRPYGPEERPAAERELLMRGGF